MKESPEVTSCNGTPTPIGAVLIFDSGAARWRFCEPGFSSSPRLLDASTSMPVLYSTVTIDPHHSLLPLRSSRSRFSANPT